MSTYKSEFLNILTERGFIHQCSDFEGLDAKLCEGVQSAYVGYDATAKSLHVGNLISIMMLSWFQECGHKPIPLMGGGTSKVGDPSGKDEARKLLSANAINDNIATIKLAFAKYLKFGNGDTDAMMTNNAAWLDTLNYVDFLRNPRLLDLPLQFRANAVEIRRGQRAARFAQNDMPSELCLDGCLAVGAIGQLRSGSRKLWNHGCWFEPAKVATH